MGRLLSYLAVYGLVYSFYVVFTGATSAFSLLLGALGSIAVAAIAKPMVVTRDLRLADIARLAHLVAYYVYYMAVAEARAHLMIARVVLSRRMGISPAIVEVPYYVRSSYGMTLIAGSITNTPGTVVVQVDTEGRRFYVHWLVAETFDPDKARESISLDFERYAERIFG